MARRFVSRFLCLAAVGGLMVSLFSAIAPLQPKASALSGAEWRAGRIIDDPIFTNKNAMSVNDIQTVLNDLIASNGQRDGVAGSCDTSGSKPSEYGGGTRAAYGQSKGNPAPFTCLKDYWENPTTKANNYGGQPIPAGAESAAQLIWDAGQQYNISPQVLLVTLQKEQGLLTDDWTFKNQLLYAMGAHCPDSGPGNSANCDPAYAGFGIQIKEAARLYRYYLDNMSQPWWTYKKPGVNSVLYSPNSACGASNVNIESSATAALYTYTPYQPNQAALNNLYGTGDGCSAYGNRNFWRMYNDWFGSSIGCPTIDPAYIYRLFRISDGDYLYTQNSAEICQAVKYSGYILESTTQANDVSATDNGARSLFRLSRGSSHLYTTDPNERDTAMQNYGYRYEGVPYYVSSLSNYGYPIYRLSKNGHYVFTSSVFEKSDLQNAGYDYQGTPFNANSSGKRVPVFRISKNGLHLYTTSRAEKDAAVLQLGYNDEGIAYYALDGATGDDLPVYRLQRDHRYLNTIYDNEKLVAQVYYGYGQETSYYYAYPPNYPSTNPVYRLSNPSNGDYLLTTNAAERDAAAQRYGYRYEGVGFDAFTP